MQLQDDLDGFKMNRTDVLDGVKTLTESMALDLSKKIDMENEMIAQFLEMETEKLEEEKSLRFSTLDSASGKPSDHGDDAMVAAEALQVDGQEPSDQGSTQKDAGEPVAAVGAAAIEAAGEKETAGPVGDDKEHQKGGASTGAAAEGSGNGDAATASGSAAAASGAAANP